jgi:hypothetical protein
VAHSYLDGGGCEALAGCVVEVDGDGGGDAQPGGEGQ